MVPNHAHEKIMIHLGRNSMGCCVWLLSCVQFFCNSMDCSLPGSSVHGIFQARTLEWVAISFSNAWKWKMKVKSLSCVWLLVTPWTAAHQAPPSMGFSRQESWSGVPWPSAFLFLFRGHSYAQAQEGERWVQKAGHSVRHLEATDVCC